MMHSSFRNLPFSGIELNEADVVDAGTMLPFDAWVGIEQWVPPRYGARRHLSCAQVSRGLPQTLAAGASAHWNFAQPEWLWTIVH